MYSLSSGDVSYVVPLDHVDLKFLRRSEQIRDNVKPLWSPRQEEYTEFQLKAWRATNDENPQDTNAKITTMCHICDTQVPVLYLKEHYNSKKHKNFLKIIDEALSRLRSNVNTDSPTVSSTEPSKSTYFCEACCISVLTNNKEIHEGSTVHKSSTKQDEIIEKLLMAFKKDTANSNDVIDSMDGNNNSVTKKQDSKVATPLEQVKEYINTITNKMTPGHMEIDVLDENHIVMKVNGSSFKVHIDNFNGFVKVDQGVECLLCNVVVKSKSEHIWTGPHMRWAIWHLADEQCIRQINQYYSHCLICNELIRSVGGHKVLDSNHSNKLKNALYNTTISAACPPEKNATAQLENEKIEENHLKLGWRIKTAVSQLQNEKIAENHLKPNVGNTEIQTDTETKYVHYSICRTDRIQGALCRLCACVIPDHKINIEDHLYGKNHKRKYKDLLSTNHVSKVQNGFSCDFCRIHVPETTELDHVSSKDHKTKMRTGITTNQTYCEPCMVYIDTHNLEQHRNGRAHKQKTTNRQTANDIAKSNLVVDSKSYAMATSNSVQDTNLSKSLGTSDLNMKDKNVPPSEKTKIGQTTNEAIQLTSTIPETQLPNTQTPSEIKNVQPKTKFVQPVENINQPSTPGIKNAQATEMTHIQNLMSALDLNSTTSEKKTSDVRNIQPSPTQTKLDVPEQKMKLHYQLKETSNPKKLLCKVCNKLVPNTIDNITTHVNGNNHKNNYKDLLKSNNVEQRESNFHCNKCNVPITNKNEIDHILGNRHKNFIDDDRSSTISDVKSDYSNSEMNQKPSRNKRYQEYKAKLYLFEESINSTLLCTVCLTKVRKTMDDVINHTKDVSHLNSYNELLKLYRIVKSKDGFRCNICDEIIVSQNELRHIYGSKHQANIHDILETMESDDDSSTSFETYCGFCHIYVPQIDYLNHKISNDHINCVKNIFNSAFDIYYYKTTKKSILKCKLCDCTVNNEYNCAIEHIEGSSHMTAYNKMLDVNKICSVGDKMYCLACKEIIKKDKELIHIWQANHSGNLSLMK